MFIINNLYRNSCDEYEKGFGAANPATAPSKAPHDGIDLISKLRVTSDGFECLEHNYFDELRFAQVLKPNVYAETKEESIFDHLRVPLDVFLIMTQSIYINKVFIFFLFLSLH